MNSKEGLALMILEAQAVEIRHVPNKLTNEEVDELPIEKQPFLYASGNWGPGYITIKNLVGRKTIIRNLVRELAQEVEARASFAEFVAGNATGGMTPGWILSEELERLFDRIVPFVYVRETRKKGGQKELITGIANNPEIPVGANGLVVEELVNFAQTTCHSAEALRAAGYQVTHGATILFYGNPVSVKTLSEHKIEEIYLLTLPELLAVAEKHRIFPKKILADYRKFLADPLGWQKARGLRPVEKGGTI